MKNKVQEGNTIELTAPYDVEAGAGFLVGALFAVACGAALSGEVVNGSLTGVYDLAKKSTDTPAQGAKLYWDNTNKELTTTASGNTFVGAAVVAAGSGETTVRARLNGVAV